MKILAVSYGGGHAALVAPVVKGLTQRGHDVTLLGLTTAADYFKQHGIACIGFKDLLAPSNHGAYEWGCRLAQSWEGGPVSKEETIAYLGLNYQELVNRIGERKSASEYAKRGRQAFLPVAVLKRAMDGLKPDVVFATNSPRAEQAAILAAGEYRIPSVCAVDLFALQEVQWIGSPGYATRVCVLSESVRAMFLAHGRGEEEIVVTGNPAFDQLQLPEIRAQGAKLRRARGWDDGLLTLLWASQIETEKHPFSSRQGDPELPRKIESVLRRFVRDHTGFRLVVRYHPSEQVLFIEQRDVSLSTSTENLHALLHAVDGVVVMSSTVGLEAHLIGKLVISVDCSCFTEDAPYSKMGVSFGVSSPNDLPAAILRLRKQGHFEIFSTDHATRVETDSTRDNTATQKVISVIESFK